MEDNKVIYYITYGLLLGNILSYFMFGKIIAFSLVIVFIITAIYWIHNAKGLLLLQILYLFMFHFQVGLNNLPSFVSYVTDIIILLIFIQVCQKYQDVKLYNLTFLIKYWGIFFILGLSINLIYSPNLLLYIWAVRNNARIFIFFIASLLFVDTSFIQLFFNLLKKIYIVNFFLILVQYFVFGYKGDYLGGLFGTKIGISNTYMIVFLLVMLSYAITYFIKRRISLVEFLYYLITTLIISALSELKLLFILIPLIFISAFLLSGMTRKMVKQFIMVMSISIISVLLIVPVLYRLFPFFNDFLNPFFIIKNLTSSYTGKGDIGRLTVIPYVINNFFHYDIGKSLVGIGLGSAEYSRFLFFRSSFYQVYGDTHYTWFSMAFIMVESGIIGIILYLIPFVFYAKILWKSSLRNEYIVQSLLLIASTFILFMYNSTLRTEAGYLLITAMSFGFVTLKDSLIKNIRS